MDTDIKSLVSKMTLKEKAALCSGLDYWRTKPVRRLGIPTITMADGPHGLRVEAGGGDHMGKAASMPATCFPTASALACSWDRELLREVGRALGGECLARGVSVLLGPGANIKRSPLCGRNFEYFSEDPYLTGEMAAAWIEGVQGTGVGASLKHFAANNQEHRRMTIDALADERALREIYLAGFEAAVKRARPWTVMCAYNRLNGEFCSENEWLLNRVLREEWGFSGAVVTDWGACNDRVRGLKAGQDLEMPGNGGVNDRKIVKAVRSGHLDMAALDRAAARLLGLVARGEKSRQPGLRCDMEAHHALARRAAAESAVLLKNDGGLLPLQKHARVAVIGAFARRPRFQGSGSSRINPWRLECAWDEMLRLAPGCVYAEGYRLGSDEPDMKRIEEACGAAKGADAAVVFAGLPEEYESEGFDRPHMRMPESHGALIEAVARANPKTAVVLQNGSPVEMPWLGAVASVLEAYLGGQAGGGGVADVLFGCAAPSGRLAETAPAGLADALSSRCFPMGPETVEYRESVYVGYRWFDAAGRPALFPFGHGLSYTAFDYSDLSVDRDRFPCCETLGVGLTVRNAGGAAGAEVVQLYVRDVKSAVFRPVKELKGFEKVKLEPGEARRVSFSLDKRAFAYYNTAIRDWHVESGEFEILVGASSADIRLKAAVWVESDAPDVPMPRLRETAPSYFEPEKAMDGIPRGEFGAVFGGKLPAPRGAGRFTANTALGDVRAKPLGRALYRLVGSVGRRTMGLGRSELDRRMLAGMVDNLPLRSLVTMSGGWFPMGLVNLLLRLWNAGAGDSGRKL